MDRYCELFCVCVCVCACVCVCVCVSYKVYYYNLLQFVLCFCYYFENIVCNYVI
jgi:hypothetical protein